MPRILIYYQTSTVKRLANVNHENNKCNETVVTCTCNMIFTAKIASRIKFDIDITYSA